MANKSDNNTPEAPVPEAFVDRPLFTITETYGPADDTWEGYKDWIKLPQLIEIVSLDTMLCPSIVPIQNDDPAYWESLFTDQDMHSDLHRDLNYIIDLVRFDVPRLCNVLCAILEPNDGSLMRSQEFAFCGYDLLDTGFCASAITNCGGFYDIYSPEDLNEFGLFSDRDYAYEIRDALRNEHPEEHHADCNIYALYRQHNKAVHTNALAGTRCV